MKSLKTQIAKMDANGRALLVAGINASLATLDGSIPNKLRVDHHNFEIYALRLADDSTEVVRLLRPILSALKAAKRRAK